MLSNMLKMIEKIETYINENPSDEDIDTLMQVGKNIYQKMMRFFKSKNDYLANNSLDYSADILKENGFEVIRVPSVVYNSFDKDENGKCRSLEYDLNYSNAITFKTDENEVVYIAGKSKLDKKVGLTEQISNKIGANFEKMFIDSLKGHVKPENIHFVNGSDSLPICEILHSYHGGLHCMCAEVPKIKPAKPF